MGCGSSDNTSGPTRKGAVKADNEPIPKSILDKIDTATEVHGKMAEGLEKGVAFASKAADFLAENNIDKIGQVFSKAAEVIDCVAPWLGPIGIGLKVATSFVSLFVKKGMSEKEIANENLRLNKMILEHVSELMEELKELTIYVKFGRDLKTFKSVYETYRDKLFQEGNKVAWEYMNDGTFKSINDGVRHLVFNPDNLEELLAEH